MKRKERENRRKSEMRRRNGDDGRGEEMDDVWL